MSLALYLSDYIEPDEVAPPLLALLAEAQKNSLPTPDRPSLCWVMLNGNLLGGIPFDNRMDFFQQVRLQLKIGRWPQLSVFFHRGGRTLQIQTDEGRCCRPVVALDKITEWLLDPYLEQFPPFDEMVRRGWVEWMDVAETGQYGIYASWTNMLEMPDTLREYYAYMEMHSSLVSGYAASVIPYSSCNPGPRVSYAAAMGRAALGAHSTNITFERDDSLFDNLNYPQQALTRTAWADESYAHDLPTTQNAVVAILSAGGNNQEDAIIINQASIDRGMFRSTRYRTYHDVETTVVSETKTYQAQQRHCFDGDFATVKPESVDLDGLVPPGRKVEEGDILMHKVIEMKKTAIHYRTADGSDIPKANKRASAAGAGAGNAKPKRAPAKRKTASSTAGADEESKESKEPAPRVATAKPRRGRKTLFELATSMQQDEKEPSAQKEQKEQKEQGDDDDEPAEESKEGAAKGAHTKTEPLPFKTYGDVLDCMRKVDPSNAMNAIKFHDPAVVDRVTVTETDSGDRRAKVRMRSVRIPQIGDKLATQAPQKGVIGEKRRQEDMPWTEEGIVPDIILVPHCIPSRMTLAQFLSMVGGIVACSEGSILDATAFQEGEDIVETLGNLMVKNGYTRHGSHVMYDGATGVRLEGMVFMGVTTYQRMKQMSVDKYHVRARGQVQLLSRQPTEGKAASGGLRLGEMERDCLITAGLGHFLREKFLFDSDGDIMHCCEVCGLLCKFKCPSHPDAKLHTIAVPWAVHVLTQELAGMNIGCRFRVDK